MSGRDAVPPKPVPGDSASRDVAPGFRLATWRDQHLYAAFASLGRLARTPAASVMTLLMMALALLLPLALAVLLANLARFGDGVAWPRGLSVFLKPDTTAVQADALARRLRDEPGVAAVDLRTPDEARAQMSRLPGFGAALALLEDNPLPAVLAIEAAAGTDPAALAQTLGALAEAEFVARDEQLGTRFHAATALLRRLTEVAMGVFALLAALTVGNTVRLDVAARREEILVLETVGAEPAFVRRPFLYAGLWFGLASALLAVAAAYATCAWLSPSVAALADSYGSAFRLVPPGPLLVLGTLASGIVLGWIGARLAVAWVLNRARRRG